MAQGWVCVHRQLLDNPIFKNDKLFRVFMYCLLKASHTKHDQIVGDCIVPLEKGDLATGRKAISAGTGLTIQNVRTSLLKLEKLQILTIKPTSKYSVISITNWNIYQQTNHQLTINQPSSNHQVTTNNNVNKGDNGNHLSLINDGFEHWWKLYPVTRRKNKSGCLSKFKAKCKKLNDDDKIIELINKISNDIDERVKQAEDVKYIPMTEPYLNQERWRDGE